jgi:hypothetical protein
MKLLPFKMTDVGVAHLGCRVPQKCILAPFLMGAMPCCADAGADITAVDDKGRNMGDHAVNVLDRSWVDWVLSHGCPVPQHGIKDMIDVLQVGWFCRVAPCPSGVLC